jgi:hypothetical protein
MDVPRRLTDVLPSRDFRNQNLTFVEANFFDFLQSMTYVIISLVIVAFLRRLRCTMSLLFRVVHRSRSSIIASIYSRVILPPLVSLFPVITFPLLASTSIETTAQAHSQVVLLLLLLVSI